MMEAKDICMSKGEKRPSEVEELRINISHEPIQRDLLSPHASKILHHELVDRFCWVGHVNFPFTISEVRLGTLEL